MAPRRRHAGTHRLAALVAVVCLGVAPLMAQPATERYAGRQLQEVLQALQAEGLRIVFSSELVTPDLRVETEPDAREASRRLDEILKPHGLRARSGPGGILQIIRAKRPKKPDVPPGPETVPSTKPPTERPPADPVAQTYRESVTVLAPLGERRQRDLASDVGLSAGELQTLGRGLAGDPLRVVHSLPRVTSRDDFRSEFSVRGSPYRHIGVVIDGVSTPWLQHSALGRGDTGTIAMLGGDVLEQATLQVGAYPRRHADRLGAQLDLTLREGSRTATSFRAGLSGTQATVAGEGPIGTDERGSWLVALRKSYVEWPVGRTDHRATVFGFGDVQAKLVYDLSEGQRITTSVLAGRSSVQRDDPNPVGLSDGTNDAAMVTVGWRSMLGSRTVVDQRASVVAHEFLNANQSGQLVSRGDNGALGYRVDVARALFGGVLEAGGQIQRFRGARRGPRNVELVGPDLQPLDPADGFDDAWWTRSSYVHFRWAATPRLTIAPGLRVTHSTLVDRRAVDRWLQGEWSIRDTWTLHASAGVAHQFPELDQARGWIGTPDLEPERATQVDVGVGRRLSSSARWDVTVFSRREQDILREPEIHPRLVNGAIADWPTLHRYENALTGTARGVELLIERRSGTGFSGWASYSFGHARSTDPERHEAFRGDFDQRHALNLAGLYRLRGGTTIGATFRGGTNFPIPGYLVAREGSLYVGSRRNAVQLPAYARLDVHAERTFVHGRRRYAVFAEVVNVLNRTNLGLANGVVRRDTGEALGFTERLFPRVVSAGLRIEF